MDTPQDIISEELHGIFQFQEFENVIEKPMIPIDPEYIPFQVHSGYFVSVETPTEQFKCKDGSKMLHCTINYFYLKKEYQKCLELCIEWIELNKTLKKPSKGGEVVEAAIRSSMKLNRPKQALLFCNMLHKDNQREPGMIFTRAKVHMLNGLNKEAISLYLEYLIIRNNDYVAWYELGKLFYSLDKFNWARAMVDISIELIMDSHRPNSPFSQLHVQTELSLLISLQNQLPTLYHPLSTTEVKDIFDENEMVNFVSKIQSNSSIKIIT
jgi:hypothetical protein